MIVCHCHATSDRTVRRAVRRGASTCAEVARQCGAGAGCGGCRAAVAEIIETEQPDTGEALAAFADFAAAR